MAEATVIDDNVTIAPLLSSSPAIPYDITYQIVGEKEEILGQVSAHKFVLSMNSTVFRGSFFGFDNVDKMAAVKNIKDTTVKAFQTMLDFIYRREIDFKPMTVREIFDLVSLAELYMIPGLMATLRQQLEALAVTKDQVMEVAAIAVEFGIHETASKTLLANCARVLATVLKTRQDVVDFVIEMCSLKFAT